MKRFCLIYILSLAITWVSVSTAQAVERIPVQTIICYPSTGLASWTYRSSGNTTNGSPEHRGYVFLNFNPHRTTDGHILQTNVQHPVNGLVWDSNFANIVAPGSEGEAPVVCGSVYHRSIHKFERNCRLEGRIVPAGPCPAECGEDPAYLFDGELLISR